MTWSAIVKDLVVLLYFEVVIVFRLLRPNVRENLKKVKRPWSAIVKDIVVSLYYILYVHYGRSNFCLNGVIWSAVEFFSSSINTHETLIIHESKENVVRKIFCLAKLQVKILIPPECLCKNVESESV